MTFAEFKKKWSRYQGKETSAYQSHFDDLCRVLGQQTPNEADPSGSDFFCFDNGSETARMLDGKPVAKINPNLTGASDTTSSTPLAANELRAFIGDVKGGSFDVPEAAALAWLAAPNPNGRPNSDVLLPWINSLDILRRPRNLWIIDFGDRSSEEDAAGYEQPFDFIREHVLPHRKQVSNPRERVQWWIHSRPCTSMRDAIAPHERFIVTNTLSKHRVFAWQMAPTLPDHQLIAFSRTDDYFFGVLQSHLHSTWALRQGTRLETRPRYTPTTSFETFPFPFPDDLSASPPATQPSQAKTATGWEGTIEKRFLTVQEEPPAYGGGSRGRESAPSSMSFVAQHRAAIAAAAKELNEMRERWLNPPEWTETRTLEFPGSVTGPWARYIVPSTINPQQSTGLVRYPRLEPKDAECAAKLKKRTLTNLYNERPAWLDLAHKKLDAAVARAYGWEDLAAIIAHDGPGDVYDFESGGWLMLDTDAPGFAAAMEQFTKALDEQILERLLKLNLERAAAETKAAQASKSAKKPKTTRAKTADELL